MDTNKLKVTELRTMLAGRNLDTKGPKADLVKRLNDSFADESFETETSHDKTMDVDEVAVEAVLINEDLPVTKDLTEDTVGSPVVIGLTKHSNDKSAIGTSKIQEDEPWIADNIHCLDWYDSDLSLIIDKENMMRGEPICRDGWAYVWSGARSTQGFAEGKVWYEVKVLEEQKVPLNEIRVGWSTNDTELMLGKVSTSFAYCSKSGKKRQDNQISEYGVEFSKGDVIGAFLDLTGSDISMTYTKNGETQGEAFKISKTLLNGRALFPHVSTRGFKFEVNFGKVDQDVKAPLDGYQFAASATSSPNFPRIERRENCEMIMMVGLPGCGKTTWVDQLRAKYPERRYNVIGVNTLMDRMEMDGEPIMKRIQEDKEKKQQRLLPKIVQCVKEWTLQASKRRRNFIQDQTNVFSMSHSKENGTKIVPFNGMSLKAVVIVPSDDDYKSRVEGQKKVAELAKDCWISTEKQIMEMKAAFTLPPEGDESPFKEISFAELNRDEAAKLVEEYNKLAKEKGFRKEGWNRRGNGKVRGVRGMSGLRSAKAAQLPRQHRNAMRNLPSQTMMQQASLIQNALMQNGWGGPLGRGTSSRVQGQRRGNFNQNQMLQSMFGGQMMQPQGIQSLAGTVNQMLGRGGYYGMGMNARRF